MMTRKIPEDFKERTYKELLEDLKYSVDCIIENVDQEWQDSYEKIGKEVLLRM